jgi:hypothetical protein
MVEWEYLEFYRIDVSATMRRVLIPSVLLVMFGASMLCFSAAARGSQLWKPIVGFLGAVGILTGLLSAIVGMARLLREDAYVGVVEDGLVIRSKANEVFLSWDDVTRVAFVSGVVVLELREGPGVRLDPLLPPAKMAALALRLEDWRRKSPYKLAPVAAR